MANTLYDYARESFLSGSLSWATTPINVALISGTANGGSVTQSTATANYKATYTTWAAPSILGTSAGPLVGLTWGSGAAGASDITVAGVSAGANGTISVIVLWASATIATITNPLVAYIDTAASGLPITPNGGNITVSWSRAGIGGIPLIFKL